MRDKKWLHRLSEMESRKLLMVLIALLITVYTYFMLLRGIGFILIYHFKQVI
jgi:uncharacterized membrane protein